MSSKSVCENTTGFEIRGLIFEQSYRDRCHQGDAEQIHGEEAGGCGILLRRKGTFLTENIGRRKNLTNRPTVHYSLPGLYGQPEQRVSRRRLYGASQLGVRGRAQSHLGTALHRCR